MIMVWTFNSGRFRKNGIPRRLALLNRPRWRPQQERLAMFPDTWSKMKCVYHGWRGFNYLVCCLHRRPYKAVRVYITAVVAGTKDCI